jgi:hypothetical protein
MTSLFLIPVQGSYTISSKFGDTAGRVFPHQGLDMACPVGTTIVAAATGTVSYAGISGGYGNLVSIDTEAQPSQTRYGHLSRIDVHVGQHVTQGQAIGLSGGAKGAFGAGDSSGPHLHFEIRIGGKAVDPAPLIGGTSAQLNAPGILPGLIGLVTPGWWEGLTAITKNLSDPKFWTRTGVFILGSVLLFIALMKIFSMSDIGKSAIQSTKSALTTAAIVAP